MAASENLDFDRKVKDSQIRTSVSERLIQSGEKERLKDLLRSRLIECGWREDLKNFCKTIIKNKGLEKITVNELVQEVIPRGRATVPDAIKAELLQQIKTFLASGNQSGSGSAKKDSFDGSM